MAGVFKSENGVLLMRIMQPKAELRAEKWLEETGSLRNTPYHCFDKVMVFYNLTQVIDLLAVYGEECYLAGFKKSTRISKKVQ